MDGFVETVCYIFGLTLGRYLVIAGIAFALFYYLLANRLENFKIQKRKLKRKSVIREILYSSQSAMVFTVITLIILFTPLKEYTLLYDDINEYSYWWIGVSTLLSLVLHDAYFYWMHRLLHHKKVYKYAHVVHHKSTNPSPWTSYSFHILEAIPEGLILLLLVFVLPMHVVSISLFTIASLVINVYGHLGYEIAPKALRHTIFFQFFNTSVHHNMHHSRFHGNYGLYFRFWDRVMKTEIHDYEEQYDAIQEKRFSK
jgi:Delta7-sterol 5-desaturase